MTQLVYFLVNIVETLLRLVPFPCETGLIKIGNPDRDSPVFLTVNFHLTVQRVQRSLRGLDGYLLVANSRGVNVWCAASGGLLTTHSVISVLKTSGVENLVDHRQLILPQLAATGVEVGRLEEKTGWRAVWGPVYASEIPAFLQNELKKTAEMRRVTFPWRQRLEMAASWAFPISILVALIAMLSWPEGLLPLVFLTWALALLLFSVFPFYQTWLGAYGRKIGPIFVDFVLIGLQFFLWFLIIMVLALCAVLGDAFSWGFMFQWGAISLLLILLLGIDLTGSTPTFKSGLHEDRWLKVVVDGDQCGGDGACVEVCPRNCFALNGQEFVVSMPRAEQCVQCGACIVQCPWDALYFSTPDGGVITPDTVRRYKLNLMGQRVVREQ
jgi:NAD-dependent dihydropyrimidine dehydrogenase PreA subunit